MVRESDAPGMYLSSRSKAAVAAMLGGVRGADGGGRGAGRWAVFIKDVGVNRTIKKWDDGSRRRGKNPAKTTVVRSSDSQNISAFHSAPLNELKQQQTPFLFRIHTKTMENPHEAEQAVLLERIIKNVVRWHHSENASILPLTASSRTNQTKRSSS